MLYALIDYANKSKFNQISSEEILGEVKIRTPKFSEKGNKIYAKKILKRIDEYKVENVILNRDLYNNKEFCKILEEARKNIVTGRKSGKVLLMKILQEISNYTKYPIQKMKMLLLMNEYSLENIELIEYLSNNIKELNVLSRNYSKYEKTSNTLFDRYGYVVNLYDNETVNEFKRINVVINLDFSEAELQSINFARTSIVISLNERINILRKGFNGIIINDIDIIGDFKKENFRSLAICEARLYKSFRNIKENERIFNTEKYIINGYIGKKGKISTEEFEKIGKTFSIS